jgi:ATP-binding cassette subfamily B protein
MGRGTDAVIDRLRRFREQLPYIPRALTLVWQAGGTWTTAWLVLLLIQGVLPVAMVFLTKILVDSLVAAVDAGGSWQTIRQPLLLALLMAGLLLLTELLRAATRWVRTAQSELVSDHLNAMVHQRTVNADLAFWETPAYHDMLHRARVDASHRPVALVESLGGLVQNGITLVAMAGVLVRFAWWVPIALILSTLPALWVVFRFAVRQHEWRVNTTPEVRRSWYYDWLLTHREPAPEVRLFGLGPEFSYRFNSIRRKLRGQRIDLARSQAAAEMAAGAAALAVMGAALAWMVVRTLRGAATLGGLAMFFQAFSQGQKLMRSLLDTMGQVVTNTLFLENLFDFLSLESEIVDPKHVYPAPTDMPPSVRFRDVTFRYPSSKRYILDGFDLDVKPGEIAALLGVNGAGKSTLFRLLCRLYDPEEGGVEIGGRDLRDMTLADARRLVTILFQEPVHYSETVRGNIEMGDLTAGADLAAVDSAIALAGGEDLVDRLPYGIDTLLGSWFSGGTELSGGEWQRVALARAALRDAPVILLDEPTSAMDSWSEIEWVGRFRALAEGRTAIIISHRLTTAMKADVIHVMDDGKIVESGSHLQLLRLGGRYAEAWNAQTSNRP